MERVQALTHIIELAMKWQQKHEWAAAFKAADRFREYRDKGTERFDDLSDERHSQVIAAHAEFIAMENLLRQHAPQFLQLVPGVNFFTDSAADHSLQIQNVKRLEGAVRDILMPVSDPWSIGRSKADWLQLKHMTTDQWNAMRKTNAERIQHVQGNERKWQFKRSLCEEHGFVCPEFAEK
jgi:hypothetical protein